MFAKDLPHSGDDIKENEDEKVTNEEATEPTTQC